MRLGQRGQILLEGILSMLLLTVCLSGSLLLLSRFGTRALVEYRIEQKALVQIQNGLPHVRHETSEIHRINSNYHRQKEAFLRF